MSLEKSFPEDLRKNCQSDEDRFQLRASGRRWNRARRARIPIAEKAPDNEKPKQRANLPSCGRAEFGAGNRIF
jgi:hypothetical protein